MHFICEHNENLMQHKLEKNFQSTHIFFLIKQKKKEQFFIIIFMSP